jgi:tetratricopeptide (TPR) repeat protein
MSLEEISAALKPAEVDPLRLVLHADILLGDSTVTDRLTALAKQRVKDFDVRYGKVKLEYYASHAATAKTATAYRKYGSVLLGEDRYDEAVKQFRTALTIDANTDNAYFNMGAAYERSGQLEAALESYTNELKVDPTDDEVPFRQGRVAYKLKRYEQALAYLSVAVRVRDTANTQFYRGLTLEALERFKEAQAAFQDAVEIDHDHRGAREGVARAAAAVMRGGR